MKSRTLKGSSTTGTVPLSDCFAADSTSLLSLSVLSILRSERSPITGATTSTPISVAFSTNHSKRSMFLVGQTAIVSL